MHVDRTVLEPRGQITMSCMRSSTGPVTVFWESVDTWAPGADTLSGVIQEMGSWLSGSAFPTVIFSWPPAPPKDMLLPMWSLQCDYYIKHDDSARGWCLEVFDFRTGKISSYSGDLEDLTSIRSYFMDIILERASGQFGGFLPWCGTTLMRMSNWSSQFCLRSTPVSP